MRTVLGLIIALVVGVSLNALGVSIIMYGLAQPINCQGYSNRSACGNLPLIVGVFMTLAGLVTLGGAIIYAVIVREQPDSELADD